MAFRELPYMGSFQRGKRFRSSDPLRAAWREIEKLGTVDRLSFIANQRSHSTDLARSASLKVRQAVELWKASRGSSILTRPLLLYYSILNLTRGMMLPRLGTFGEPSHGLSFTSAPNLLDCKATVTKSGTFRRFAESLGVTGDRIDGRSYTLRDLFAVLPEMHADFPLLRSGDSSVVVVAVRAIMNGPMRLFFHVSDLDEEGFAQQWETLFPWMKDDCTLDSAHTLRLKENPKDENEIAEFCRNRLIHDLRLRENAYWFDHRTGNGIALLPRLLAYIAAMHILSNVSRYEPEFLEAPTSGLNDLGFVLESFLDNCERFFPQLTVDVLYGQPVFFE